MLSRLTSDLAACAGPQYRAAADRDSDDNTNSRGQDRVRSFIATDAALAERGSAGSLVGGEAVAARDAGGLRALRFPQAASWRIAAALILSRLLVLAAALAGSSLPRASGWVLYDPQRTSAGFGHIGNLLGAAIYRWDSVHYLAIAQHGYGSAQQTAFFPLYPLLMRAGGWLVGSDVVSGLLISLIAFGTALVLLHRLTELELGSRAASATVVLLCFAPLSLFFSAVYTESLFLALAVGAVYAARHDRFALAATLAALASITRVYGILLVAPLALLHLRRSGRLNFRLAWLGLPPAALGGFLLFLHARGYGWLAPMTAQTSGVHAHSLAGPLATLIAAVRSGADGLHLTLTGTRPITLSLGSPWSLPFQNLVLLVVLAIAVGALVACWRRLPRAYSAYAILALALTISSPVQGEPLKSLDRYTLTIFPLWMAAGAWAAERRLTRPIAAVGAGLLTFYTVAFAAWSFVA